MHEKRVLDVVVVGGGLSGLLIAHGLHRTNADWALLDARDILGGRLVNDAHGDGIDLGGAWIWPKNQPFVVRLLKSLGIQTFEQPDDPSSTRIVGGAVQVIRRLAESLPEDRIRCNKAVLYCSLMPPDENSGDNRNYVRLETANQEMIYARRVVFAVPPKVLSKHVFFDPPLSEEKNIAMAASQTWMAGVTKIALVYTNKFWDSTSSNIGFESDGPAFHVYDSSSVDGKVSALTFFAHVPPTSSAIADDAVLASLVSEQLSDAWTHLRRKDLAFQADSFVRYHVQRWPMDIYISEDDKPTCITTHRRPMRALSENEWGNTLFFAGSETDQIAPGVMEGAVGSALRVLKDLEKDLAVDYFQQAVVTNPLPASGTSDGSPADFNSEITTQSQTLVASGTKRVYVANTKDSPRAKRHASTARSTRPAAGNFEKPVRI